MCDSEYHIFCLSPPLKSVPTNDWFCPMCWDVIKAERKEEEDHQEVKPLQKSKRGRPKGKKGRFTSKGNKSGTSKRGPGRPPKRLSLSCVDVKKRIITPSSAKDTITSKASNIDAESKIAFNFRSKLNEDSPSNLTAGVAKATSILLTQSSKLGGCKVGKAQIASNDSTVTDSINQKPMFSSSGMLPSFTNSRSRSGRVVKRNTVYDEMTEGGYQVKSIVRSPSDNAKELPVLPEEKESIDFRNEKSSEVVRDVQPKFEQQLQMVGNKENVNAEDTKKAKESINSSLASEITNKKNNPKTVPQVKVVKSFVSHEGSNLPLVDKNDLSGKSIAPESITYKSPNAAKSNKSSLSLSPNVPSSYLSRTQQGSSQTPSIRSDTNNNASVSSSATSNPPVNSTTPVKVPRRKPGARECMQISRRFGVKIIPQHYMDTLLDYCSRGKVEHLIRMRERLDDHSRFLEAQLAGMESFLADENAVKDESMPMT